MRSVASDVTLTVYQNKCCMPMANLEKKARFFAEIRNIPCSFHSADLRRHFSDFVETSKFQCFHFRHRVQNTIVNGTKTNCNNNIKDIDVQQEKDKESTQELELNVESKLYSCLVKLKSEELLDKFVLSYHMKPWTDRQDSELSDHVLCSVVKYQHVAETMPDTPELRPPLVMPRGNVGTPTKHFTKLIQKCEMPARLIQKLGIDFTRIRCRRKYGSVFFDYGPSIISSVPSKFTTSSLTSPQVRQPSSKPINSNKSQEQKAEDEDNDEDGGEEWERHESLHNDVTEQGREKERLYEEDMEVVWEKGGSGLVFYTDAVEWDKAAGDFDEKTADDWDVDMEAYYVPGAGDKDAKDLLTIRQDQLDKEGRTPSVFKKPSSKASKGAGKRQKPSQEVNLKGLPPGAFDAKGIARHVMRKQGWRAGQSLGRSQLGIKEPIEVEGQKTYDKSGFGYHGEELVRTGFIRKPLRSVRDDDDIIISTIYDDPSEADPEPQPLLRATPETQLKHRKDYAWKHNPFALV